ncbi:unnamed protein product [marine sediment metagenome]|uniref:Uncharacterized protein n=1 Tax=marine sediment metagenome TaxID=412755 RepID=X1SMS3_9ZZZZ
MIRITKPPWLRSWLSKLNWTIFTWQVFIGDAIESGINWAIDKINVTLEWAIVGYNWGVAAFNKAIEIGQNILPAIARELQPLWNKVLTWWSELDEWWSTKRRLVLGWIDLAKAYARDLFLQATSSINSITGWLDNFKSLILPTLTNKRDVADAIEADVKPVRDEVNKHTNWLDMIIDLFTNPEQFFWDMLERMFRRFW